MLTSIITSALITVTSNWAGETAPFDSVEILAPTVTRINVKDTPTYSRIDWGLVNHSKTLISGRWSVSRNIDLTGTQFEANPGNTHQFTRCIALEDTRQPDSLYIALSIQSPQVSARDLILPLPAYTEGEPKQGDALIYSMYPNPFGGMPSCHYWLGFGAKVRIDIVNLQGETVMTPVDDTLTAGNHSIQYDWSGSLPCGVYLVRISTDGRERGVIKTIILK